MDSRSDVGTKRRGGHSQEPGDSGLGHRRVHILFRRHDRRPDDGHRGGKVRPKGRSARVQLSGRRVRRTSRSVCARPVDRCNIFFFPRSKSEKKKTKNKLKVQIFRENIFLRSILRKIDEVHSRDEYYDNIKLYTRLNPLDGVLCDIRRIIITST